MYNVLNQMGKRIQVKQIDINLHRHLSGRSFDENDACVKQTKKKDVTVIIPENPYKNITMEEAVSATGVFVEDMQSLELTIEQARELYTVKYGRKPHPNSKLETIISKL